VQFAPIILVFFVLMDITIAMLIFVMDQRGLEGNLSVAIIMSCLAITSLVLLIWYMKRLKNEMKKYDVKMQWV
jgi:hypothetical protein